MTVKLDVMNRETTSAGDPDRIGQTRSRPEAHFFIYQNLAYVSDQRFAKDYISIGRSPQADVVLDHKSVADIHALVHFEGEQAFLTNKYPNNGLRLNGRSISIESLRHEDVIDIGPFSLKIKIDAGPLTEPAVPDVRYAVRLVNRYKSAGQRQAAAERLARLLHVETDKLATLIERDHFIIKKNLDSLAATRWQNTLIKAGIICDMLVEEAPAQEAPPVADLRQEVHPGRATVQSPPTAESIQNEMDASLVPEPVQEPHQEIISFHNLVEDEEEDEDEVWEAPFSLAEKLKTAARATQGLQALPRWVQVVKTIGCSVVEASYLKKGQKYYLDTESGLISLAHYRPRQESAVYITPQLGGFIENERGETIADLNSYKSDDYRFKKGKPLYQIPLPDQGAVVITDAGCQYRISYATCQASPSVSITPADRAFNWRHWACSAGVHLLFLLCISIYMYFQAVAPKMQGPHFVKIDPEMLKRLESVKIPEPPKKEPPPKPEPVKVAQKVEPLKEKAHVQKKKPAPSAAHHQKKNAKVASTAAPSRHPNAGGGFGQGNVKNRNINQTGILSVLGSASLAGPTEAIAAVTNLDAVPVPGATEKNFTVGGLKGSLGNGKIAVATGQIVQTKGSRQVLRSAGARGKGEVAALERGSTGKKQVQAMVTAKMSSTVKIEGGMSREMVKRVIDQHLDEITNCYETALMTNPNILGRIVFEWKILMDGRVGEIRIVASSVNSNEIHDCIKSAIKSWQFPKPVGAEVVVSYPFVFDLVAF